MNQVPREESRSSLCSVEDMINSAVSMKQNRVNYKMIQAIFHIMARQMRMLKSQVDLRICDPVVKKKKKMEDITSSSSSSSSSTSSPTRRAKKEKRAKEKAAKAARKAKEEEAAAAEETAAAEREAARIRAAKEEVDKLAKQLKTMKTGITEDTGGLPKEICEEAELFDSSDSERTGIKRTGVRLTPEQKADRKKEKEEKLAEIYKDKTVAVKTEGQITDDDKAKAAKKKAGIDVYKDQVVSEEDKLDESKQKDTLGRKKGKEKKAGKVDKRKGKSGVEKFEEDEESESDKEAERGEKIEGTAAEDEDEVDKKKRKRKKVADESIDFKTKEKHVKKKRKGEYADETSTDEEERASRVKTEKREKMSPEEREKFEAEEQKREKEKIDKMSSEEAAKYEKEKKKEKERVDKMSQTEREKYEKEKEEEIEKIGRMSHKERLKYEKEKEKEKDKVDKMSPKEREKYEKEIQEEKERVSKLTQSQKDIYEREKEREKEKVEKMSAIEKEKFKKEKEKEREKIEKMGLKEREKYEKETQLEREKMDKMSPGEREKYEKGKQKEKEKMDKMSPKEREKYQKEKRRGERTPSETGISIKESERKGDKILVVEKGPTTYGTGRVPRVGSVDCVSRSEFELLEAAVNALKKKAGPLPMPAMPDNRRLLDDISKGSATLTDTMQAMQMAARLQAAEAAIARMADLLTQLASSGALPKEVVKKIGTVTAGLQTMLPGEGDDRSRYGGATTPGQPPGKSVAIDPESMKPMLDDGTATIKSALRRASAGSTLTRASAVSGGRASVSSHASTFGTTHVTHVDLGDAMDALSDNLKSYLAGIIAKAQTNCETAATAVKTIEDKMAIALKLNGRLSTIVSLVTDYSQQLHGFDAGLVTQMAGFQEQISLLRKDLAGGLTLLQKANNNAESAALTELNDRYETLVTELDNTLNDHGKLNMLQNQLGDELRNLVASVEILREQKADRDEVLDGLRDKADSSRLKGLLTEEAFATARVDLEDRLNLCYDKFHKQENVWMDAIKDLSDLSSQKAELMQLLAAKDDAQTQLREIQERLAKLALVLGEPMAAIVTRQVSKNATCGPCMVPALQGPTEQSYGRPHALPQARPAPLGQEEPCTKDIRPPHPPDDRPHTCLRWVGGSHTLVTDSVRRVKAPPTVTQHVGPPVKIYPGQGTDGRLYVLERELVPCVECNECYRERLPGEDPPDNSHVEVCLRDDQDKMKVAEKARPSPTVGDGAGDTGG